MKPNLDFFTRHIDIRKWRFVVYTSALVVVAYGYALVTSILDNDAMDSAISAVIFVAFTAFLRFQITNPPRLNRYWVLVLSKNSHETGGPYIKETAFKVFAEVGDLLYKENHYSKIDTFMVQSEDKDTALNDALKMMKEKEKDEAESKSF